MRSSTPPILLLAAGLVALAGGVALAEPAVQCRADSAGQRALLRVSLLDLFDPELLRLVELGLEGRVHLQATLYRRRRLWFDARLVEANRVLAISWSRPRGTFLIGGSPVTNPNRLELDEMVLPSNADEGSQHGDGDGQGYIEVSARLEVVTARSLGQVARWLVASKGTPAQPTEGGRGILPRALVEYLAADLARTSNGRCPVRPGRRK